MRESKFLSFLIFRLNLFRILALEREALIFCRLRHKNIVGFHGISLNPLLLVLELCEGTLTWFLTTLILLGNFFSSFRRHTVFTLSTNEVFRRVNSPVLGETSGVGDAAFAQPR